TGASRAPGSAHHAAHPAHHGAVAVPGVSDGQPDAKSEQPDDDGEENRGVARHVVRVPLPADRSTFVHGAEDLGFALEVVGVELLDVESGALDVLRDVPGEVTPACETFI